MNFEQLLDAAIVRADEDPQEMADELIMRFEDALDRPLIQEEVEKILSKIGER